MSSYHLVTNVYNYDIKDIPRNTNAYNYDIRDIFNVIIVYISHLMMAQEGRNM
jgi:hypothetical protein